MKSIRCRMIVLSTAFYLFLCIKGAYSAVKISELDLEMKPMFAMDSEGQLFGGNLELKEFYDKYNAVCGSEVKKYHSLLQTVSIYIQRYVNLFLTISGHMNGEKQESDDSITVDLEITMSPEDLAYLQSISKASDSASALRDLSRLESILSKVVEKKRGFLLDVWRLLSYLVSFVFRIIHHILFQTSLRNFIPLLTILLVVWLMRTFLSRKSSFFYLGIIINSLILWDSFNLYRRKIKEADIEYENLKLSNIPDECLSQSARWYHWVMTVFTGDRCLEYQKRLNRVLSDEVTLVNCVLQTYASYVIQTPMKILGRSIRDFTGEISALWPRPLRWLVNIPLISFVIVSVFFFILILCGKRLRLSFFGAAVEVGDATVIKETKIINVAAKPRVLSSRSLNMLGKSKFLRRFRLAPAMDKTSISAFSGSECAGKSEKTGVEESPAVDCSETAKKEN